jgi:hypothetical protein
MSDRRNGHVGWALVVALWAAAAVIFVAGLAAGAATLRFLQIIAGLCVVAAGLLVANDFDGVATLMGRRSSRRWRGRTSAPEASDPNVAARASQFYAWTWVAFGAVVVIFALTFLR